MIKKILSLIIFAAVTAAAITLSACANDEDLNIRDSVFASFTAEDYDGNIIDETVFADCKVTMIYVWGTFCAPCKKEAPYLAELNKEYAENGFQVIGIPIDANRNSAADAREVIAATDADFRNLKVSVSLKKFVSGVGGTPYTVFVNSEGKQIGKARSGAKSKKEWEKLIVRLLEKV